jgi:hypothetical protein
VEVSTAEGQPALAGARRRGRVGIKLIYVHHGANRGEEGEAASRMASLFEAAYLDDEAPRYRGHVGSRDPPVLIGVGPGWAILEEAMA